MRPEEMNSSEKDRRGRSDGRSSSSSSWNRANLERKSQSRNRDDDYNRRRSRDVDSDRRKDANYQNRSYNNHNQTSSQVELREMSRDRNNRPHGSNNEATNDNNVRVNRMENGCRREERNSSISRNSPHRRLDSSNSRHQDRSSSRLRDRDESRKPNIITHDVHRQRRIGEGGGGGDRDRPSSIDERRSKSEAFSRSHFNNRDQHKRNNSGNFNQNSLAGASGNRLRNSGHINHQRHNDNLRNNHQNIRGKFVSPHSKSFPSFKSNNQQYCHQRSQNNNRNIIQQNRYNKHNHNFNSTRGRNGNTHVSAIDRRKRDDNMRRPSNRGSPVTSSRTNTPVSTTISPNNRRRGRNPSSGTEPIGIDSNRRDSRDGRGDIPRQENGADSSKRNSGSRSHSNQRESRERPSTSNSTTSQLKSLSVLAKRTVASYKMRSGGRQMSNILHKRTANSLAKARDFRQQKGKVFTALSRKKGPGIGKNNGIRNAFERNNANVMKKEKLSQPHGGQQPFRPASALNSKNSNNKGMRKRTNRSSVNDSSNANLLQDSDHKSIESHFSTTSQINKSPIKLTLDDLGNTADDYDELTKVEKWVRSAPDELYYTREVDGLAIATDRTKVLCEKFEVTLVAKSRLAREDAEHLGEVKMKELIELENIQLEEQKRQRKLKKLKKRCKRHKKDSHEDDPHQPSSSSSPNGDPTLVNDAQDSKMPQPSPSDETNSLNANKSQLNLTEESASKCNSNKIELNKNQFSKVIVDNSTNKLNEGSKSEDFRDFEKELKMKIDCTHVGDRETTDSKLNKYIEAKVTDNNMVKAVQSEAENKLEKRHCEGTDDEFEQGEIAESDAEEDISEETTDGAGKSVEEEKNKEESSAISVFTMGDLQNKNIIIEDDGGENGSMEEGELADSSDEEDSKHSNEIKSPTDVIFPSTSSSNDQQQRSPIDANMLSPNSSLQKGVKECKKGSHKKKCEKAKEKSGALKKKAEKRKRRCSGANVSKCCAQLGSEKDGNTAKNKKCHSHCSSSEDDDSPDSSSSSDNDDCFSMTRSDTANRELERRKKHPRRLHDELWHNDPGLMNDGPVCRCSAKARRFGIRHGFYPGEDTIINCDHFTNNKDRLYHYRITISPAKNFLINTPTVINHDSHEYIFEGFSIFSHYKLDLTLPPCKVIRFNIRYDVFVEEERFPESFCVKELLLFETYLFREILELVDLKYDWNEETGCSQFHLMPRFVRNLPDNGQEILSMSRVLIHLLKSDTELVKEEDLSKLYTVEQTEWQNFADRHKGTIVTKWGMKPCAVRIDQIDRDVSGQEVVEEDDGIPFPLIVHFGIRPPQLSYAGNAGYQRAWRRYVKYRHLLSNMPKPSPEDKSKLQKKESKLQAMRTASNMKRDVTVAISSKGFRTTGICCDLVQHAMLIPVLVAHLRFHKCLESLEGSMAYLFHNRYLLQLAMTHPSYRENFGTNPDHARNALTNCGIRQPEYGDRRIHYASTRKRGINTLINIMAKFGADQETESDITHNERLEFLGDAVVEFVTSIHLFHIFPDLEEGGLATYRAAIVQNQHLAVLAQTLNLDQYMLYAHGSDLCHDSELRHAMANCFEALMGALFLDGSIEAADRVFGNTLFGTDDVLLKMWRDYPKHPLQRECPSGDRHWISSHGVLQSLNNFEKSIGIKFNHIRLLARAFTDRSLGYNNLTRGSNQRLEFLGDTVLQLISSEYLYRHFPDHHEGHLSLLRSSLVNNRTQSHVCDDLGMSQYAMRGDPKSEMKTKDRADLLEAFLGALYIDRGLKYCIGFCQVCFFPRLSKSITKQEWNDPKSKLQQCCLTLRHMDGREPDIPVYKVTESLGPTNTRTYIVAVYFRGKRLATAQGHSIQEAEMNAAALALEVSEHLFPQLHHQKRVIDKTKKSN